MNAAGSLDDQSRGSRPRNGNRTMGRGGGGGFVRPGMGMQNGGRGQRGASRGGMARGAGRLGPGGFPAGASARGRGGRSGQQRLSATEAAGALSMLYQGFDAAPEDQYAVRSCQDSFLVKQETERDTKTPRGGGGREGERKRGGGERTVPSVVQIEDNCNGAE